MVNIDFILWLQADTRQRRARGEGPVRGPRLQQTAEPCPSLAHKHREVVMVEEDSDLADLYAESGKGRYSEKPTYAPTAEPRPFETPWEVLYRRWPDAAKASRGWYQLGHAIPARKPHEASTFGPEASNTVSDDAHRALWDSAADSDTTNPNQERDAAKLDAQHERMVAQWFEAAEAADPARYAVVCEAYPVQSRQQRKDQIAAHREVHAFGPLLDEWQDPSELEKHERQEWKVGVDAALATHPVADPADLRDPVSVALEADRNADVTLQMHKFAARLAGITPGEWRSMVRLGEGPAVAMTTAGRMETFPDRNKWIGTIAGTSQDSAKVLISRARRKLQGMLAGLYDHEPTELLEPEAPDVEITEAEADALAKDGWHVIGHPSP